MHIVPSEGWVENYMRQINYRNQEFWTHGKDTTKTMTRLPALYG